MLRGEEEEEEEEGEADSEQWESVKREVAIMKKLTHPNIVRLVEVMDDPTADSLYLVMECCTGGTMMTTMMTMTPPPPHTNAAPQSTAEGAHGQVGLTDPTMSMPGAGVCGSMEVQVRWVRRYFRDLLTGLSYLHLHHVLHRDIKPSNLLLSHPYGHPASVLKIGDFGMSEGWGEDEGEVGGGGEGFRERERSVSRLGGVGGSGGGLGGSRTLRMNVGSAAFLAPEQCGGGIGEGGDGSGEAGEWAGQLMDVWAVGVTLYFCLFQRLPFQSSSRPQLYHLIAHSPLLLPPPPVPPSHPDHPLWLFALDLLSHLLIKDPSTRFSLAQAKAHPFTTLDGVDSLPEDEADDDPTALRWGVDHSGEGPAEGVGDGLAGVGGRVRISEGEVQAALTEIVHRGLSRRTGGERARRSSRTVRHGRVGQGQGTAGTAATADEQIRAAAAARQRTASL